MQWLLLGRWLKKYVLNISGEVKHSEEPNMGYIKVLI